MEKTKFIMKLTITRDEMLILNNALNLYMLSLVYAGSGDIVTDSIILQDKIMENLTEKKEM